MGRGGERLLHERLAFVVRVDNLASVAHVAVTPLCWRMRHELKSSEEGEGGEGRGKATA